ncbi:hypothetical protein PCC9214_02711 [Planktothrix tepida]|uniref:Uncharacterized protein n=1 Tax=Planktothrix pseudagardhii TaxID=132604 RepID=A0A9W4CM74_9CYAN|nr:hypothetical protein PCC9214_02711 [Planktothrix tepida]CAD5957107.1 hypothetical protein NO713_02953 [Planktothrix pseudagardhii]
MPYQSLEELPDAIKSHFTKFASSRSHGFDCL